MLNENSIIQMATKDLLGKRLPCSCGKTHEAMVDDIIIGNHILEKIGEKIQRQGFHNIYIVADTNTEAAAGQAVKSSLHKQNLSFGELVYEPKGDLVPNENAIGEFLAHFEEEYDLILAVGSGVINDICKYMSLRLKIPMMVVATAPSMDGYLSDTSAMTFGNLKISKACAVPRVIFGDLDLLKNAPMPMILAGFGDLLGKLSAVSDWALSRIINNEYYCSASAALAIEAVHQCNEISDQLKNRDEKAISLLFEGLIRCGIAMTFVQNSRPASGAEHLMSHYLELQYLLQNKPGHLHGTKVGVTSAATAFLREFTSTITIEDWIEGALDQAANFKSAEWEEMVKQYYGKAASQVIAQAKKDNRNNTASKIKRINNLKIYWKEVLEALAISPGYKETLSLLEKAGAPAHPKELEMMSPMYHDSIVYAKDGRNRYTVLTLLSDLGALKEIGELLTQVEYES